MVGQIIPEYIGSIFLRPKKLFIHYTPLSNKSTINPNRHWTVASKDIRQKQSGQTFFYTHEIPSFKRVSQGHNPNFYQALKIHNLTASFSFPKLGFGKGSLE